MIKKGEYREIVLGELGITYIKNSLEYMSLGNYLLEGINWSDWEARTILPIGVPNSHLYDFLTGGIFPSIIVQSTAGSGISPIPNMDTHMVVAVDNYLKAGGCCIVYDPNSALEDPWLSGKEGVLVYEREIYHCQTAKSKTATIDYLRGSKETLKFTAILTREEVNISDTPTRLERVDLHNLVNGTDVIFTGAYDGEGFLFCIRKT